MTKKITVILVTLLLIVSIFSQRVKAENDLTINPMAYLLIDPDSGRVLEARNADQKRPMASTTKIMTAIMALEYGDLSSIVNVSSKAASVGGSSFGLKAGEKISLENLLYGLLLPSGNDAATAIAEHIGQTEKAFVEMMNKKAIELGALNTHFENSHGLDEPNHYTTAIDLYKIAKYAWKFDKFRKIVQTKTIQINEGNYPRQISNTNRLLWGLEGTDGIKTGYTGKAGRCLVATANINKFRLFSVVLGSYDHFGDSNSLLRYGFEKYDKRPVVEENISYTAIPVSNGVEDNVLLLSSKTIAIPLKEGEKYKLKLIVPKKVNAPIKKGQALGQIDVFIDDVYICSTSLITSKDIREKTPLDIYNKILQKWLGTRLKNFYKKTYQKS